MRFHVANYLESPRFESSDVFLLVDDPWDDFGFKTLYHLYYLDPTGRRRTIGGVKIYKRGAGQARTVLKPAFNKLGKSYVSLGESQEFYENLIALGEPIGHEIMEALRDAAWDSQIFRNFASEDGVQTSLLRTVTGIDRHKFAAIAHMRAVLSPYNFTYTHGIAGSIEFRVEPESTPPTNIHAIIGRNGVGKTLLLRELPNGDGGIGPHNWR